MAVGSEQLVVAVRLDATGRFRIHQLHVRDNGEPVNVGRLRALRLSAIEGLLNLPAEHAAIQARLDEPPAIDLATALRHFTAPKTGVYEKSGTASSRRTASGRVPRRPARGYDDPHYERVADVYRAAFRRSGGAAPSWRW